MAFFFQIMFWQVTGKPTCTKGPMKNAGSHIVMKSSDLYYEDGKMWKACSLQDSAKETT